MCPQPTTVLTESNDDLNARSDMAVAIARACDRIAPLWPLKHFVAVNPFLGFAGKSFAETCATFRRVARTNMLMPRAYYLQKIADGLIKDADLEVSLAEAPADAPVPSSAAALKAAARITANGDRPAGVVATVAEVLDRLSRGDRQASRTAFMIDEISKWCAAYFDEGQAAWKMPWRELRPYAAWREAMRYDRNPEAMGIKRFRATVAALPVGIVETVQFIVQELGIPDHAVEDYLHRALFDIQGWASYARYRGWDSGLDGKADDTLAELLAIRVAWGYALFKERTDPAFLEAWRMAMRDAGSLPRNDREPLDAELCLDLVLHNAFEKAHQRRLLETLYRNRLLSKPKGDRKAVQAAFCIDVRSEVFRRAFETVTSQVETFGFAGFFGFPIEYVPIGSIRGRPQCPVLLKPVVTVREQVEKATADEEARVLALRLLRRRAAKAWKAFKVLAVSSFTFVEAMGLSFAFKIVGDSLGRTRPVPDPERDGLDADVAARIGPSIEPQLLDGHPTGFDDQRRIAMAEAVLRAMSMTKDFARLIMLTGHGSTTVNNPHASSLDCGACGGHTGEANARVAAAIMNDPAARAGLGARGIHIPADTWFLACLHDTTTDDVTIFDEDNVPASHAGELKQLKDWLKAASALSRAERAPLLEIAQSAATSTEVVARSRDWSQVRPEWGLAGNVAFVAAPRERTVGLDLKGRAFLHTYDYTEDRTFGILELIMTAPMVVASWINLQYFGSTVNNGAFGSGNKTLHNVAGALGVLEGNAGDLRPGLPWQSVHDGKRFIHEPLRLNVFIEAPERAIDAVIAKHEGVRHLLENGWVHLFGIQEEGRVFKHYAGRGRWLKVSSKGPMDDAVQERGNDTVHVL